MYWRRTLTMLALCLFVTMNYCLLATGHQLGGIQRRPKQIFTAQTLKSVTIVVTTITSTRTRPVTCATGGMVTCTAPVGRKRRSISEISPQPVLTLETEHLEDQSESHVPELIESKQIDSQNNQMFEGKLLFNDLSGLLSSIISPLSNTVCPFVYITTSTSTLSQFVTVTSTNSLQTVSVSVLPASCPTGVTFIACV